MLNRQKEKENISKMKNAKIVQDLQKLGIKGDYELIYNPSYEELYQAEVSPENQGFEKAELTESGAVSVKTGIFTGRSPKDRYIVQDDVTKDTIFWDGKVNLLLQLSIVANDENYEGYALAA